MSELVVLNRSCFAEASQGAANLFRKP